LRAIATVLLAASLAACASSSSGTSSPGRQRDLITMQEIQSSTGSTAYEVIEMLRPEMLRTRGSASMRSASPEYAVVYVDGVRSGGLEALRNVPREMLQEIRYLNGADATTLYGTGHGGGAIQVRTRRG
jgi:outer membrane cobalamin receptor